MKTTFYICMLWLATSALASCNDHDYVCNDPDANFDSPAYHDVNDLYQTYGLFWKPVNGWVGDAMPFYEEGKYHVMYLHDARDGAPTFHPFAMCTTTDFVNYQDNGIIIECGEDNSQEDALGTGSTIKEGDTYYTFYTGHNGNLTPAEKIYLATSKDLKTWTKQTDFVLEAPDKDVDRNDFRDPFVMKEGDVYKMLITSRAYVAAVNDWQAVILQYSSSDLLHWTLEEPFYFNGERILECPDVFTMGDYQYLIYSNWDWADQDRRTRYVYRRVGTTEWTVPAQPALDDDFFYAGKTAGDGTNRYLFGWCYTRENHKDTGHKVWAGSLIVHQLTQNSDGTLNVKMPSSIENALSNPFAPLAKLAYKASTQDNRHTLEGGKDDKAYLIFDGIKGPFRMKASVNVNDATRCGFEFGASGNRSEVHDIVIDINTRRLSLERVVNGKAIDTITSVELPQGDSFDIDIVVENAVCVTYINGVKAFTNRIYQMNRNGWGVFAEGGTAQFDMHTYR